MILRSSGIQIGGGRDKVEVIAMLGYDEVRYLGSKSSSLHLLKFELQCGKSALTVASAMKMKHQED